jgi:hypothetical protein
MRADVTTVEEAREIELAWVREHLDVPTARWLDALRLQVPANSLTPWKLPAPPLGSWKLDMTGDASVLVRIPVSAMTAGEGDWEFARRMETTQRYAAWMGQGQMPPPLDVVESDRGALLTLNRRRWLAAQLAGVEELLCWYSAAPLEPYSAHGRWYMPEWSRALRAKWAAYGRRDDARSWFDEHEYEALRRYYRPEVCYV